jgi:hypothetical protein
MTKKDYILIAATFKEQKPEDPILLDNWRSFVNAMIETFRLENSRFNPIIFRNACGY